MAEVNQITKPVIKIAISIPNEGCTVPPAYDNHMLWNQHLGALQERTSRPEIEGVSFQFFHFTAGRLLTPAAREALADNAINSNMDYILMLDDDSIVPMDLFERLYRHNVDVVAPLAFTRNPPHFPVLYQQIKGWDAVAMVDYFINTFVRNYPKDSLIKCDAVGFGAVLIKMDVIRKMKKPYFMSTCGTGEDILFCYNAAQQAGAKIYMDTSTKLGHLGHQICIDEVYAENYWKNVEKRDIEKEFTKVEGINV